MIKIYRALTVLLLCASLPTMAQVATNYSFSQYSGTYTPITPTSVLFSGTFDDDDPATVSIPAFTYDGNTYTEIFVDPNGFVGLGGSAWFGGSSYYPISDGAASLGVSGILSPFGRDLENADVGSPEIGYAQVGNEIVVQWKDVHRYRSGTNTEVFSFQVRLNTVTGTIDFVYDAVSGTSTATGTPEVGIEGPDNTFATNVNNRFVDVGGDWAASQPGVDEFSSMQFNPPTPAAGQVYEWTLAAPCAGTPTLGSATASVASVCSGTTFNLNVSSLPTGSGISYQWQTSSDSITFVSIGGATTSSFNMSQSADAFYRLIATCTASGESDTSTVVHVALNPATLCYCVTDIGGDCGDNIIANVEIVGTTLNSASTCVTTPNFDSYQDFPASGTTTATLYQNQTYVFNITMDGTDNDIVSLWIDYNQNGVFEASEWTQVGTNLAPGLTSISITIPNTALTGTTKMRIRSRSAGNPNGSGDACSLFFSGETEDYTITIATLPTCTNPPSGGTISGPSTVCPNTSARLLISGQTLGTQLQWQSSTDNITFSDIAAATNPILNTPGIAGTTYFRARVICADTAYSNVLTINTALPVAGTISGPSAAQANTLGTFVLNGSTADTIRWQFATNPAGPYTNLGPNDDSLVVSLDLADTVYIRALVMNVGGCKDSTAPHQIIITLHGNDVCDAIPLNLGANGPFINTAATTQSGEVVPPGSGCQTNNSWCNTNLNFSMWFSFVAPASGRVTIQSPDFDTQLALWKAAACDSLLSASGATLVAANDDDTAYATHGGVQYSSFVTATCLNPGETYFVQLDAYSTSSGDTTRIILTDMGATSSAFSGLDSVYCEGSAPVTLVPVQAGGTFSGTGVSGAVFNPVTAGVGTFQIKYKVSACDSTVKTVKVVSNPVIGATPVITNVLCYGNSTGAIDVTITGGTAPFSAYWSNGFGTVDLINMPAGTYSDSIVDFYGCHAVAGPFQITQPASALSAVIDSTHHVDCFGNGNGSVAVTISGGTSGYTSMWSNGSSNEDLSSVGGGVYTDTITDANGCMVALSATVTEPSAPLTATLDSVHNVNCNGASTGAIYVTVAGGTAPYQYNWSSGASTSDLLNVPAGSYTGTVTDLNGCTFSTPVAIPVVENPAIAITVDSVKNIACNGQLTGSVYVSVTGGVGSYSYLWSNNATTQDLVNVAAGTYTLGVTDSLGCSKASSPQTITQFAALVGTIDSVVNIKCHGQNNGGIYLHVSGGAGSYTYLWSNGVNTLNNTNLPAGTYTGTITDANGCTYSPAQSLTISEPSSITVTSVVNNEVQNGAKGAINISVNGGITPYTFNWGGGITTEDRTGLDAGVYTVTVSDKNGCTATHTDTVKLIVTGIEETEGLSLYEVYPNPVTSKLFVKATLAIAGDVNVQLTDMEGRLIAVQNAANVSEQTFEFNMTNTPEGIYLLRLSTGSRTVTKRISVVK